MYQFLSQEGNSSNIKSKLIRVEENLNDFKKSIGMLVEDFEVLSELALENFKDFESFFNTQPVQASYYIHALLHNLEVVAIEDPNSIYGEKKNLFVDMYSLYRINEEELKSKINKYDNHLIDSNLLCSVIETNVNIKGVLISLISVDIDEKYRTVYSIREIACKSRFNKNLLEWFKENEENCKKMLISYIENQ